MTYYVVQSLHTSMLGTCLACNSAIPNITSDESAITGSKWSKQVFVVTRSHVVSVVSNSDLAPPHVPVALLVACCRIAPLCSGLLPANVSWQSVSVFWVLWCCLSSK
eukprot:GHUV01029087.1.p1 GENE.GHUV01029087.1~~GHUV01029087.1.p1  ORF type:complete len:107 (-),score=13.29 GHUV01029087.1:388-708(-)